MKTEPETINGNFLKTKGKSLFSVFSLLTFCFRYTSAKMRFVSLFFITILLLNAFSLLHATSWHNYSLDTGAADWSVSDWSSDELMGTSNDGKNVSVYMTWSSTAIYIGTNEPSTANDFFVYISTSLTGGTTESLDLNSLGYQHILPANMHYCFSYNYGADTSSLNAYNLSNSSWETVSSQVRSVSLLPGGELQHEFCIPLTDLNIDTNTAVKVLIISQTSGTNDIQQYFPVGNFSVVPSTGSQILVYCYKTDDLADAVSPNTLSLFSNTSPNPLIISPSGLIYFDSSDSGMIPVTYSLDRICSSTNTTLSAGTSVYVLTGSELSTGTHIVSLNASAAGISDGDGQAGYDFSINLSAEDLAGNAAFISIINNSYIIPPAAITDLSVISETSSSLTLSWSSPGRDWQTGTLNTDSLFRIQISSYSSADWNYSDAQIEISTSGINPGDLRTYNVTGLSCGFQYYFKIWTRDGNSTGWSQYSNTASSTTLANMPGIPQAVSLSTNSIRVDWNANSNPSNTQYVCEISTDEYSDILASSQTYLTSSTFTDLVLNSTYWYRVKAISAFGSQTDYSSNTLTGLLLNVPANPSIISVSTNSVSVSWDANSNPDGTHYYCELSNDNYSSMSASSITYLTSATFFNLKSNATYWLRVKAKSPEGTYTGYSSVVSTMTIVNQPGIPQAVSVTTTTMTVSWDPNNNAVNTKYICEISSNNYSDILGSSETYVTSATLSGLEYNTTYWFRVKAVSPDNLYFTDYSSGLPKITLVNPPSNLNFVSISTNSVSVNWGINSNPSNTQYMCEISTNNNLSILASTQTYDNSANFFSLIPNTTYWVRVKAMNLSNVSSAYSTGISTSTLANTPGGLQIVFVSNNTIVIGWNANSNPNNTQYIYELSNDNFSNIIYQSTTSFTSAVYNGLTSNATYWTRVRAVNSNGVFTDYTPIISTMTFTNIPGVPNVVSISTTDITINWSADNNSNNTLYTCEISSDDFSNILNSSDTYSASATFSSLEYNTVYWFRVKALGWEGYYTNYSSGVPTATLVNSPINLTAVSVSTDAISVNWNPNSNPGNTQYICEISTDNYSDILVSSYTYLTNADFFNLVPNTTYWFRVRAMNLDNIFTSYASDVSTSTLANPPKNFQIVSVSTNSISASWDANSNPNWTQYVYELSNDNYSSVLSSSQTFLTNATFSNLLSNSTYWLRVRAVNSDSVYTDYSPILSTMTPINIPANLQVISVSTSSVGVSWNANNNPSYTLYTCDISSDNYSSIFSSSETYISSAVFSGLDYNTVYWFRVNAKSESGVYSGYLSGVSTVTLVNPPANLQITSVSTNSVSVNWDQNSNPSNTQYVCEISTDNCSSVLSSSQTFLNAAAFSALTSNATYWLRTRAVNLGGVYTDYTSTVSTMTDVNIPGVPQAITLSTGSIRISWSPNNNSPETKYTCDISSNDYASILASSATFETLATFTDLYSNTSYWFRINAMSVNGVYTNYSSGTLTGTLLNVPTNPQVVSVSTNAVSINWDSNSNPEGTEYVCEISNNNYLSILTSSQTFITTATFSGLMSNATYWLRVKGMNSGGIYTDYSPTVSTMTLVNIPGPIQLISVSTSSINVTWDSNNNSPYTWYECEISSDNYTNIVSSTLVMATAVSFSELSYNTTYWLRVRAMYINDNFTDYSAGLSTATLANIPGIPGGIFVSTDNITVEWVTSGNPPGTQYICEMSTDNYLDVLLSSQTLETSATFYNLIPNTSYWFRIKAINFNGISTDYAAGSPITTLTNIPTNFQLISVSTDNISVSWNANSNPENTSYYCEISTDNFLDTLYYLITTSTSEPFPSLVSNTTYWLRVRAINFDGIYTEYTPIISTMTMVNMPGTPQAVNVTTTTMTINWSPNNNSANTLYTCELSSNNYSSILSSSSTYLTSADFSELKYNATYWFRVKATSADNLYSTDYSTGTPMATLVNAPINLGINSVTKTSIGVSWEPNNNPSNVQYICEISSNGYSSVFYSTQTIFTSTVFSALNYNTTYWFRVKAVNVDGISTAYSTDVATGTLANVTGSIYIDTISNSFIKLSWDPNGNPSYTNYDSEISTNNFATVMGSSQTSVNSALFAFLNPNASYWFRIRAINVNNIYTDYSTPFYLPTLANPPASLSVASVSTTTIGVSWDANSNPGYTPYFCEISSDDFSNIMFSSETYVSSASFSGLNYNTTYWFRARAKNLTGIYTEYSETISRATLVNPPINLAFVSISTSSISVNWNANSNPSNTRYVCEISNDGYASILLSSNTYLTTASFNGLVPNTTHWLRVRAANIDGVYTDYAPDISTATLANAPTNLQLLSVSTSAISVNWDTNSNPAYTQYISEISTDNYSSILFSSGTDLSSFTYFNLVPNTTYWTRVKAVNLNNIETNYSNVVTTSTLANPPENFQLVSVSTNSILVSWDANNNQPNTKYICDISTDSYLTILFSSETYLTNATLSDLVPNTAYSLRVRAVNSNNIYTAYSSPDISTATLANIPANFTIVSLTTTTVSLSWNANNNPPGTLYTCDISSDNYSTVLFSSETYIASAAFYDLDYNTTYWFRVKSMNMNNVYSDYFSDVSTITLVNIPVNLMAVSVSTNSISVNWDANSNPLTTKYTCEISSDNYSNIMASSVTYITSSAFYDLVPNTTYWFRVKAENFGGWYTEYLSLVSTSTLANPPTNLALVLVSTNSISVNWDANSNPSYTRYNCEISNDNFSGILLSSLTYITSASFNNLVPNTTYWIRVNAINTVGAYTDYSSSVSTATLANPPGTMSFGAVSNNFIAVSWNPNSNPDGTQYACEISSDNYSTVLFSSGTVFNSSTFIGLEANTTYFFRVRTVNVNGIYTDYSSGISTATLANVPSNFQVVNVSTESIGINWDINLNPLGTLYVCEISTDNYLDVLYSSQTLINSATFYGLIPNTSYWMRVKAVNVNGINTGYSTSLERATLANTPANFSFVSIGANNIFVNWDTDSNPLNTLYTCEISTDGFADILKSSSTNLSSAGFTGLTPNTTHWLRVRAVNLDGIYTNYSSELSTATLANVPISFFANYVSTDSIGMTWNANLNPLGTQYSCDISTDNFSSILFSSQTLLTQTTFYNLSYNTTYWLRVAAVNLNGIPSNYTTALQKATLVNPPGPISVGFTANDTIGVSWTTNSNPDGVWYTCEISTNNYSSVLSSSRTLTNEATFTMLWPNTTYWFQVKAVNVGGVYSAYSSNVSTSTLANPPGLPGVLSISTGSVTINWFPNANPFGTLYVCDISSNNYSTIMFSSQTYLTQATLLNLTPNSSYWFQVKAVNNNGISTNYVSDISTVTLANVPGYISISTKTEDSIVLEWTANSNPDWTEYTCEISSNNYANIYFSSATLLTSATFYGLTSNATYWFRVKAVNLAGTYTDYSYGIPTSTLVKIPGSFSLVSAARHSLTVHWDPNNNGPETNYICEISADDYSTILASTSTYITTATFYGLDYDTTYWFRAKAKYGEGLYTPYSTGFTAITLKQVIFSGIPVGIPPLSYASFAWGDYNNDGNLDLAICGQSTSTYVTRIYRNDGNGVFTLIVSTSLTGVYGGSMAWGDYNNDGLLDLAVCGTSEYGNITNVYKNNGNDSFTDSGISLPGLYRGSLAWGDYNNDGYLDLAICGLNNTTRITQLYINTGGYLSPDNRTTLPGVDEGSIAWGDYNNDGYLDLAVCGNTGTSKITKIYRNDKNGIFTDISAAMDGVYQGSLAWGDYNNDGYLDLAVCGNTGSQRETIIYQGNGTTFSDSGISITGVDKGSLAWGDFANDGYPGLAVCGDSGSSKIVNVYRNNSSTFTLYAELPGVYRSFAAFGDYNNDSYVDLAVAGLDSSSTSIRTFTLYGSSQDVVNAPPSVPSSLSAGYNRTTSNLEFRWQPATDDKTPSQGLNYELSVSSLPIDNNLKNWIIPGNSGLGAAPFMGNCQHSKIGSDYGVNLSSTALTGSTTFYWRVRTIDSGFKTSVWSSTQTIFMNDIVRPAAVTNLSAQIGPIQGQITLKWSMPGDNGWGTTLGTGSKFAIEYSSWAGVSRSTASAQVIVSTQGVNPGKLVSYNVTGLDNGTTYYLTIWHMDPASNWSFISNTATSWAQINAIPPAAVNDLSSDHIGAVEGQIRLSWSMPGDDGWINTLSTGSAINIQYSTSSSINWSTSSAQIAYVATDILSPPYTPSYWLVTSLNPGTTYYFKLWTADKDGNWSGISNTATNWAQNDVTPPAQVTNLVSATGAALHGIDLSWSVPGDDGWINTLSSGSLFKIQHSTDPGAVWSKDSAQITVSTSGVSPGSNATYAITNLLSNSTYYLAVWYADESNNWASLPSNITTSWTLIDSSAPATVNDFAAVSGAVEGQIALSWSAPGDDGFYLPLLEGSQFKIQYSTDSEVSWSTASAQITVSTIGITPMSLASYIVEGLPGGGTYYMAIWNADEAGNWSGLSNIATAWVQMDVTPPAAITNLSGFSGSGYGLVEGQLLLTWSMPGDDGWVNEISTGQAALQYSSDPVHVAWSTASAQLVVPVPYPGTSGPIPPGTLVPVVMPVATLMPVTSFIPGTTYYFKLWHADERTNWSGLSNTATAWAQVDVTAPGQVTDITAATGINPKEIDLTWTVPGDDGYQNILSTGSEFKIQYSTDSGVSWSKDSAQITVSTDGVLPGTVVNYTVKELLSDATHYFVIWYADERLNWSIGSGIASSYARHDPTPPAGVTILSAQTGANEGEIDLSWNAPGDDYWNNPLVYGSQFALQRSTWQGVELSTSSSDTIFISTSGVTPYTTVYYTVTGLHGGTTFWLSIWHQDAAGNWSVGSSTVSAPAKADVIPPAYVSNLRGQPGPDAGTVLLNWSMPGDDGWNKPLDPGSAFSIEYSTSAIITWSKDSAQVRVSTSGVIPYTDVSYLVTGLMYGTTYYFKIWHVDDFGNWSLNSNTETSFSQVYTTAPASVTNLSSSTGANESEINLSWSMPGRDGWTTALLNGSAFIVQYSTDYSAAWSTASAQIAVSTSGVTPGTIVNYTLNNLINGSTYYFKIWHINDLNNLSRISNTATSWAQVDTIPPSDVINLVAVSDYAGQIRLNWSSPGDNGIGLPLRAGSEFVIEYSSWSMPDVLWSTGSAQLFVSTSGVMPGSSVSYNLTGLAFGSSQYVKLWYRDGSGNWSLNPSNLSSAIVRNIVFNEVSTIIPAVQNGSLAWGDYNNDGYLDLAICGSTGTTSITRIYQNNGDGTFSFAADLIGVENGSLAWGDFNNDGNLDIAVCGSTGTGSITRIYQNNGNGTFSYKADIKGVERGTLAWGDYNNDGVPELAICGNSVSGGVTEIYQYSVSSGTFSDVGANLKGVDNGSLAWGDYNNDGLLDLAVCGFGDSSEQIYLYKNNGDTTFSSMSSITTGLPLMNYSSIAWGDYNNDGNLDLAICGYMQGVGNITRIYQNNGDGTFTDVSDLAGVQNGSLAWGDYNNDGKLDLAVCGSTGTGDITKIYQNNGDGTFSGVADLTGVEKGSIVWGDYNNDGALDIAFCGSNQFKLLRNDYTKPNSKPSAPSAGFKSSYNQTTQNLELRWGPGYDIETSTAGLEYEIRLSTLPISESLNAWLVAPKKGAGLTPALGNYPHSEVSLGQLGANIRLSLSQNATYYWQVRAIDTGFVKSDWSTLQAFLKTAPSAVTNLISRRPVTNGEVDLTWSSPGAYNGFSNLPAGSQFKIQYSLTSGVVWSTSSAQIAVSTSDIVPMTQVQYTVTGLSDSSTYYFKIWYANDQGSWSGASNTAVSLDTIAPYPVTNLGAYSGEFVRQIRLTWNVPGDNNIWNDSLNPGSQYKIQYSTWAGVLWSASSAQTAVSTSGAAPQTFVSGIVTGLSAGTTYYLKIWYIDSSLNLSQASNVTSGWTKTYSLPPSIVSDLSAQASPYEGEIRLNWSSSGAEGGSIPLVQGSRFVIEHSTWDGNWDKDYAQISVSTYGVTVNSPVSYLVTGLDAGTTFYFKLWHEDEQLNWSNYSNTTFLAAQIDSVSPSAVTNLAAQPGATEGRILLTWSSPSDSGISSGALLAGSQFAIQHSTTDSGWDRTFAQTVVVSTYAVTPNTGMSYVVTGFDPGTTYYFAIWNADHRLNWSAISNTTSSIAQIDITPPAAVTNLSAQTSIFGGTLNLSWSSPGDNLWVDALSTGSIFMIQHSTWSGVVWSTNSAQLNVSTQSVTPGQTVNYKLTGLDTGLINYLRMWYQDESGNLSGISNTASAYVQYYDTTAPHAVTDLTAWTGIGEGVINLSWHAPGNNGFTGTLGAGSQFNVQYSTWPGVLWSTSSAQVSVISTSSVVPQTLVSYTLTGLSGGSTYYMRVWNADEVPNWSDMSNAATALAQIELIPPAAITTLFAQTGINDGEVILSWLSPGDNGWDGILGPNSKFGIAREINQVDATSQNNIKIYISTSNVLPHTPITCTVTGLTAGTSYYFAVWTFDKLSNISDPSNTSRAAAFNAPPGTVTDLSANTGFGKGEIDLSWSMPGEDGWKSPLSTGAVFSVQYSTEDPISVNWSTASAQISVSTRAVLPGTVVSYTVNNLVNGATYYFKIWHVDGSGELSVGLSNTATSWAQSMDLKPPAAVTSLQAMPGGAGGQIKLAWFAPGNDGWVNNLLAGSLYAIQCSTWSGVIYSTSSPDTVIYSTANVVPSTHMTALITGLNGGATYYIGLWYADELGNWAVNPGLASTWAKEFDTTAPAAVTNLNAVPGSIKGQISLNWSTPGNDGMSGKLLAGSQFAIQYSTWNGILWSTGSTNGLITKSTSDVQPGTLVSYLLTGLTKGSTYFFKIWHMDESSNWSLDSNIATTWAQVADFIAPAAITTLSAHTGDLEGKVVLSWYTPGDDGWNGNLEAGSKFGISYDPNIVNSWSPSNIKVYVSTSGVSPSTLFTYTVTGLTGATSYYFTMWTFDGYGNRSDPSNTVQSWSQADITSPAAVTDLQAVSGSNSKEIILSWASPGDDGWNKFLSTGSVFAVQYSTDPLVAWSKDSAQLVVSTSGVSPVSTVSYKVTNLFANTTYYLSLWYRDESLNWSGISNGATAWTLIDNIAPSSVTLTAQQGTNNGEMVLKWNSPGDDGTNFALGIGSMFVIQYSTDSSISWSTSAPAHVVNVSTQGVTPLSPVSYTVSDLGRSATYFARMWYVDGAGNWSGISNAATTYARGALLVASVAPNSGLNNETLNVTINGSGFFNGVQVLLKKTGQPDITGTGVFVTGGNQLTCNFDLVSKALGAWDIEISSGEKIDTLFSAFTVKAMAVLSITPNSGTDSGPINATIKGSGFVAGSIVRMFKSGDTDIAGTSVVVVDSSTINCILNLNNKSGGKWTVEVSTTVGVNTVYDRIIDGFTITLQKNGYQAFIGKDTGGTMTIMPDSGKIVIEIMPQSFSEDVMVTLSTDTVAASDQENVNPKSIGLRITTDKLLRLLRPITVTIYYRESDVVGLDEMRLAIAYYDDTWRRWVPLPSTVYPNENKVVAVISHLSRFALVYLVPATNLGDINVFPNPYNPSRHSQGFAIENLTSDAEIKIFTVSRELVKTIDYTDKSGRVRWDGKNDAGSEAASGIYVIYVKSYSTGEKKIIKFAIEK